MFLITITVDGLPTDQARFSNVNQANEWYDLNQSRFPEGHVKTITDISGLIVDEQLFAMAKKKAEFGKNIILLIHVINNKKLASGAATLEQLVAALEDPLLSKIERLLMNGSIEIALGLIQTIPNTYFNSEDLDLVTDKIETFLSEL